MAMERDPWLWSVADVQHFFRHQAADVMDDLPHPRMPEIEPFVTTLADNDVTGAVLLLSVDSSFLREDCGLRSLGIRSSVLYCIRKLQSASQGYGILTQAVVATADVDEIHTQTPVSIADPTAEAPKRAGEVLIEDERGRKRRKLDLSQLETEKPAASESTSPAHQPASVLGYLPDSKVSLDEMFYGTTQFGQEIQDLGSSGLIEEGEADFQLAYSLKVGPGETDYIHSQMKHYLCLDSPVTLRRHGVQAFAVLPYRERSLATRSLQSATVFQAHGPDVTAVRENAALMRGGSVHSDMPQGTTGEWDFLVNQYGNDDHDTELPLYGESISEDISTGFANQIEAEVEEAAQARASSRLLTVDRASDVVEHFVEDFASEWKENKRPQLEEKRAWTVWRKMKHSSTIGRVLIDGAMERTKYLDGRLSKMKRELLREEWSSDNALKKACEVLEVTIEDREERAWEIEVWQRKKEPHHVVQQHQHRATPGNRVQKSEPTFGELRTPASANGVHAKAQLSGQESDFEPSTLMDSSSANIVPDDSNTFFTPGGTPEPQSSEEYVASEEMSLDPMTPERGPPPSSPPVSAKASDSEDNHAVEQPGFTSDVRGSGNKNQDPSHQYSRSHPPPDSDSDELPSPNLTQLKKRYAHRPSPQAPSVPPKVSTRKSRNTEPIDLTLSSDPAEASSPASKKGTRGKGKEKLILGLSSEIPEQSSRSQIDSWNFEVLIEAGDRKRILIKILRSADPRLLDALLLRKNNIGPKAFKSETLTAVSTLQSGDRKLDGLEDDASDIMLKSARLFLCWYHSNPCYFNVADPMSDVQWDLILQDQTGQVDGFQSYLQLILTKKDKMFASPIKEIIISSDDEQDTPHKKRKKPVTQSQSAALKRSVAKDRQRTALAVQSQSTGLSQMLPNSDGNDGPLDINPVRAAHQKPVFINERIARAMKPHQLEGARFLWRELTAGGEEGGHGCLLAHTMGLGKTMQTIALLVALAETTQSDNPDVRDQLPEHLRPKATLRQSRYLRMLILCPPSLLQNWNREISLWAPHGVLGNVSILATGKKENALPVVQEWSRFGGILLLGYSIFRSLVAPKAVEPVEEVEGTPIDRILLEETEIVVADEAHTLKNKKAGISNAASRFTTESRIALTGTPMSNDIQEIYALVSWVAPGYLGEDQEFRAFYAEPIKDGTYTDSTKYEIRRSIKKLAVLKHEIEPKVHRADITALKGSLKPKVEFLITVPLTPQQVTTYKKYVDAVLGSTGSEKASQVTIFSWLSVLTLLCNHPRAFRTKLLQPRPVKKNQKKLVTAPEYAGGVEVPTDLEQSPGPEETLGAVELDEVDIYSLGFTKSMVDDILQGLDESLDPSLSVKTGLFVELLASSRDCGDKMLVFSQSIPTLQYLDDLFNSVGIPFGRIDGTTATPKRGQIIEDFHNWFDVLLVSTKAGGVGLNIQCANRVVIFDFSFNPTWEEQAIGRAYRLGQQKPVWVYRFVAGGTFETNLYNKALFKTSLTSRVVDKKNPVRSAERNTREYLYYPKVPMQEDIGEWAGKDPMVLDKIIEKHTTVDSGIRAIKTMETLQEDAKDEPLTLEEQLEVQQEIKEGKARKGGRKGGLAALAANQGVASSALR